MESLPIKTDINPQPMELASQLMQYMIEILKFTLQGTLDFLKAVKLPHLEPLPPSAAITRLNQTIGTVLNYTQLQLISNSLNKYLKELATTNYLPGFITRLLNYMADHLSTMTGKFQSFIPILLLKLYSPTNFISVKSASGSGKIRSVNGATEEEMMLLNMYIQSLIGTIAKEREQHQQDVTKLTTLEKEGVKTIENVKRVKREFEDSVQSLLEKFSLENAQHQAEINQLTETLQQVRTESEEKIIQMRKEFEEQMEGLKKTNDELSVLNIQLQVENGEKFQKLNYECKSLSEALLNKIENERQILAELEELKREKETYNDAKEKLQQKIDELLASNGTISDERLVEITNDFNAQKQKLVEQIGSLRAEWTQRIDNLKSKGAMEVSETEKDIAKANEILEAQKQGLLAQLIKEREEHKVEIEKLKNRSGEAEVEGELEATDEFDVERTEYNKQIQTLQNTILELQKKRKSSKLFGFSSKASKTAEKADKSEKTEKPDKTT